MPSVLTHYGFNKEVLDNKISFLKNNEDVYLVGAQGPDPFFFYGIIPFLKTKNPKETRKYGTMLHKIDPAEEFFYFFNYANKSKDKDFLYAYILGAGLHYILDRKVHPYVFYKTGFSDNPKMKKKYFADHTLFETNLDVVLISNRYKKYKVTPFESIMCDKEKIMEVSKMYGELAKKAVKEEKVNELSFANSYEHMKKIEKILYSKKGVKKWFASTFVKNTPLNTMMAPLKVKDDLQVDYLNIKNKEWKNPASLEVYNKSLINLIEEAKEDAKEWKKIVLKAYEEKIDLKEIKEFTNSYIYDGYLVGEKMKEFKSVYRKENVK